MPLVTGSQHNAIRPKSLGKLKTVLTNRKSNFSCALIIKIYGLMPNYAKQKKTI